VDRSSGEIDCVDESTAQSCSEGGEGRSGGGRLGSVEGDSTDISSSDSLSSEVGCRVAEASSILAVVYGSGINVDVDSLEDEWSDDDTCCIG
jgi:hypothetical protein